MNLLALDLGTSTGIPIGTIKKHATGKGNAGKDVVIAAMRALGHQPGDDNEADALALLTLAVSIAEAVSAADQASTGLRGRCSDPTHTATHEGTQESGLSTIGNP